MAAADTTNTSERRLQSPRARWPAPRVLHRCVTLGTWSLAWSPGHGVRPERRCSTCRQPSRVPRSTRSCHRCPCAHLEEDDEPSSLSNSNSSLGDLTSLVARRSFCGEQGESNGCGGRGAPHPPRFARRLLPALRGEAIASVWRWWGLPAIAGNVAERFRGNAGAVVQGAGEDAGGGAGHGPAAFVDQAIVEGTPRSRRAPGGYGAHVAPTVGYSWPVPTMRRPSSVTSQPTPFRASSAVYTESRWILRDSKVATAVASTRGNTMA